ncbi:MAG: SpoIIE family protein phosphatase [Acaryochloris sp. RU_4_1]|nr:SpoIIE family protein phosphatase [Acaryochloris sp. RU_4_1]NJR53459.1 SpoIIE family protein phosphatase [Acaryochloris sp. CRU_2_0]
MQDKNPADILVVDDTPANIRLLAQMLSVLGYKVRKATNGEMALDAVSMIPPDLILLDINMPGMDGYQVCQRLKDNAKTADIPVIFISALDEIMDKLKGFNVGAVDYITKPFQLVEVQARVKTHISLQQLQKELQHKNQLLEEERLRAGQVQADLLPKDIPKLPGFSLAAYCLPAKEVGGDFYDWQMDDSGYFNFLLGDVMGKGMPAALLMTTVRATLRALSTQLTLSSRINAAQSLLATDFGHSESFVTLFCGQLNCQDRHLSYIDAGHGVVFIKRASSTIDLLANSGIPLGILPQQTYKTGTFHFQPQDALLLFSDGILELLPDANQNPQIFASLLQGVTGAREIVDRILSILPQDQELGDDLTILILSCH